MTPRRLFTFMVSLALLSRATGEMVFCGILGTDESLQFCLQQEETSRGEWRRLGDDFGAFTVEKYDPEAKTLTLTNQGTRLVLPLRGPGSGDAVYNYPALSMVRHVKLVGGRMVKDSQTLTGVSHTGGEIIPIESQGPIPLRIGDGFDVTFDLSKLEHPLNEVTLKVASPRMIMPNERVVEYVERREPVYEDGTLRFTYIFDHPWELVPGRWTLEIWDGDKILGKTIVETKLP